MTIIKIRAQRQHTPLFMYKVGIGNWFMGIMSLYLFEKHAFI